MNSTDLQPLKGLTLPIVAPQDLPASLKVDRVTPMPDSESGDGYEIGWKSETAELTLLAASSGIGDRMPGKERIEFETSYFGECSLERSGEEIATQWFSEMESGLPAYSVVAKGLEAEDVIAVVRSLDYVRVN